MQKITKPANLLDQLQAFEVFQSIDLAALQWLIDRSDYVHYQKGETMFKPGDTIDHMQIIMQGSYHAWLTQNKDQRDLGTWGAGFVTGLLPFSRMKKVMATARTLEEVHLLQLHKDYFTEMVNVSFELTQALVGVMSSRIRDFSTQRSHDEKLMALGKLSAGLAHELNNPASAIVRSAQDLYQNIHYTPEKFKAVITMRLDEAQVDQVNAILYGKLKGKKPELSIMEQQDAMDDILDWLEDHEIEEGDDIAETFVEFGMSTEDMDRVENIVEGKHLGAILWWLESTLSLERLVNEIQEASARIAELVSSVKEYSHMDRAMTREFIDLKEGINNTLVILKHKLKAKQIEVKKDFDPQFPSFKGYAGELNQVWTNIISNAIDAMEKGGLLKIKTYSKEDFLCVDITDNGHGIPEEIREEIFESFFSTKSLTEGTGMGLDITKRIVESHGGHIQLESEPGCTTFRVCFPMLK